MVHLKVQHIHVLEARSDPLRELCDFVLVWSTHNIGQFRVSRND